MAYIKGTERNQLLLVPPSLDEMIEEESPVRIIDAFIDADSCCWYFGDGVKRCTSHSNAASHNYSKPGIYTVKLTLWKDGKMTL